jgi:uncharacterized protein (TIGR03083 family)
MGKPAELGPFSPEDLRTLGRLVIETWRVGLDRDWSVPAGTLDWSCRKTAEHTIDTVFAPALFLASRNQHAYPVFEDLRPLPEASIADLIDGLRATITMLWAVVITAEPDARAVIRRRPAVETAGPEDFAPRGALEMILHTYDISSGLDIPFSPPEDLCRRLRDHTSAWPSPVTRERPLNQAPPTSDPWSDLLERSGRPRLT